MAVIIKKDFQKKFKEDIIGMLKENLSQDLQSTLKGSDNNNTDLSFAVKRVPVIINVTSKGVVDVRVNSNRLSSEVREKLDQKLITEGFTTYKNNSNYNYLRKEKAFLAEEATDAANWCKEILFSEGTSLIEILEEVDDNSSSYKVSYPSKKVTKLTSLIEDNLNKITPDEALKFLIFTYDKFKAMALERGIQNYINYFHHNDKYYLDQGDLNELQYVFKEFIFHSQNGSNYVISYLPENYEAIREFTHNYDVKYCYDKFANAINDEANEKELATLLASNNGKRYQINNLQKFIQTLRWISGYLKDKTPENVRDKIISELGGRTYQEVLNNFNKYIPNHKNVGTALTFDLLKEFDSGAFDYPKPDLHMKRCMLYLILGNNVNSSEDLNRLSDVVAIDAFISIMNKANEAYKANGGVGILRNYPLDKMLYIICSSKFHKTNGIVENKNTKNKNIIKNDFLKDLQDRAYEAVDIQKNIDELKCMVF